MKKNYRRHLVLLALCMAFLTGCGTSGSQAAADEQQPPAQEDTAAQEPAQEDTAREASTLEDLLGEDYADYLTETITMQMSNRMEKDPEVRYFPIEENAPLSDYVAIDETTAFEVDEEGNPVIIFPAGTVTDAAHGEQRFRIPKLYS